MSTENVKRFRVIDVEDDTEVVENMESIALFSADGKPQSEKTILDISEIFTPSAPYTLRNGDFFIENGQLHILSLVVDNTATAALVSGLPLTLGTLKDGYRLHVLPSYNTVEVMSRASDFGTGKATLGTFHFGYDGSVLFIPAAATASNAGRGFFCGTVSFPVAKADE